MKNHLLLMLAASLVACTSPQQIQKQANNEFEKEYRLWNQVGDMAEKECPNATNHKSQLSRQFCIEELVNEHVRPRVLYPNLVDYMLTRVRNKTEEYAKGKINRDEYTQDVNDITNAYWDAWGSTWDNKLNNTTEYDGFGNVFGQMLLGGINAYNAGEQARKDKALNSKSLYCTSHGYAAYCTQY